MKLFDLFRSRRQPAEAKTAIDLAKHGVRLYSPAVNSGVVVTTETSLQVPTALACVRLIAQGVASLELEVFEEDARGGKPRKARDRREFRLLNRRPNRWQSSFEFREMLTAHAVLVGNGYAIKNRVGGQVDELLPLDPSRVTVEQLPDYSRRYRVSLVDGRSLTLGDDDIFHLPGLSWNGWKGLNIVQAAREAIGLAAAAEGAQALQLGKGARPHGILTTEATLDDEAIERIVEGWRAATSGANQYSTPVLDNGLKFNQVSLSAVDAQLVETRKQQMVEICAAFGVSPAVLGLDDKKQAFASVESMQRWHLVHTLNPWLRRWTERIDISVLDGDGPLFAKFDTSDITKATMKERAEAARAFVEMGIYNRNEWRERYEGLEPKPELDEHLTPLNMQRQEDDEAATT